MALLKDARRQYCKQCRIDINEPYHSRCWHIAQAVKSLIKVFLIQHIMHV